VSKCLVTPAARAERIRIRARGSTVALSPRARVGLPVIAVSADEVVWALLRAGFDVRERMGGAILLGNGWRAVEVPAVARLLPAELFAVLRQAGISYNDFVEHLVDAPTEPDADKSSYVRRKRGA